MIFLTQNTLLDEMNIGMSKVLTEYSQELKIEFLTSPRYVHLERGRDVFKVKLPFGGDK